MDAKDYIVLGLAIIGAAGGVVGSWATLRGARPKAQLDESQSLLNYQKLTAEMQRLDAEKNEKIEILTARIDGQIMTTDFRVTVEIGKEPVFTQGTTTWTNRNAVPTTTATPRRANGGLGMRQ